MSSDDGEDLNLKLNMKKKRKKKPVKKKVESDDEGSDDDTNATAKPVVQEEKEEKSNAPTDGSLRPGLIEDSDGGTLEEFYASLVGKKKKKRTPEVVSQETVDWDALQNESRMYSYTEVLTRVYDRIKANNPTLGVKTVYKIRPPNVVRDGTKKVAFTNFAEICKSLNRSQEQVSSFIVTELGTSGNIDGNNCLILKGRLNSKHIEGLLLKYINQYVTCSMCHCTDTKLVKDPHSRLTTLQCNKCNASRTVQSITGGFSAQIGRRRKK